VEGVQAFEYRGAVEHSLPGQVFVLHPDELHDGRAEGPGLFGYRQIYVNPVRIASALPALTGRPAPLPFAPPVTDDPVLARVVRTAFARAPEPLALDALVLALAEGLLRRCAAGSTCPPSRVAATTCAAAWRSCSRARWRRSRAWTATSSRGSSVPSTGPARTGTR
jgi:hypothetical protein